MAALAQQLKESNQNSFKNVVRNHVSSFYYTLFSVKIVYKNAEAQYC